MRTDNPQVTVLTLSYNSPSLICAVDSVLSQSYNNIQFIIVDDHSKKFDENELREHIAQNNRGNITDVVIIRNSQNIGITASSNIALKKATGKYIINLAGDDAFFDNSVVSDICFEFEKTGAMIITGYRQVFDSKLENSVERQPTDSIAKMIETCSPDKLFSAMEGYNMVFGCCTARSAECVNKYGLYDEQYRLLDDYSSNMKLLRNGVKFHFMERVFVKYRSGGISSLKKINNSYFEESDRLFHNEIEPFSQNPEKALRKYTHWKEDTKDRRNYEYRLNNSGKLVKPLIMMHYIAVRAIRHAVRLFGR